MQSGDVTFSTAW